MTNPERARLEDPSNSQQWMLVANTRLQEARKINADGKDCVAAAYLAGYAIECSLKALLANRKISRPPFGGEGHNLRALWAACDFALKDLQDKDGSKNYFMSDWSTDLRYQTEKNTQLPDENLINGAGKVMGRITTLIRRNSRQNRVRS